MGQFLGQDTERRLHLSKERAKYDGKHPEMNRDPSRPRNTRDETIRDRVPCCADPTNDTPVLTIATNVEAMAAAEVSVEDVGEEDA